MLREKELTDGGGSRDYVWESDKKKQLCVLVEGCHLTKED